MPTRTLCIGEILWDALPAGLFLGGAPFNVACHLHALGVESAFASCVGTDRLGREAVRRLRMRGLDTDLIQVDDELPTGFVEVSFDDTGEPDYNILKPAAWDAIALTESLKQRAERADALVFGSLAQRKKMSRQTIQQLGTTTGAVRVCDINLRPPYDDRGTVEASLALADIVKLNEEELHRLCTWFDLSDAPETAMEALAETFDCEAVAVTRGGWGALLWQEGQCWSHPGYAVEVEDPVGAGDAFLSALLAGLIDGRGGESVLDLANRIGAYVASHAGALPAYDLDTLDAIHDLPVGEVRSFE